MQFYIIFTGILLYYICMFYVCLHIYLHVQPHLDIVDVQIYTIFFFFKFFH